MDATSKVIEFVSFCIEMYAREYNMNGEVVSLLVNEKQYTPKEALLKFYSSTVYKNLENESTKYWWLSPYQLYEDVVRQM